MARNDPKFVRLPERLAQGGCLADTLNDSDFFIGGQDIVPFPGDDEPKAQRFVREHLRAGNLEAATQKERKIVEDSADAMRQMHLNQLDDHEAHDRAGHQEQQIQHLSRKTQAKLAAARVESDEEEEDEEEIPASAKRRKVGAKGAYADSEDGDGNRGPQIEGHGQK